MPKVHCAMVHGTPRLGGHFTLQRQRLQPLHRCSRDRGWGGTHLGTTTVTLFSMLHKQVPTHGASHQSVYIREIGQAVHFRSLYKCLQICLAALAEHPRELGPEAGVLWSGTVCSTAPSALLCPMKSYPMLPDMMQPPPSCGTGQ